MSWIRVDEAETSENDDENDEEILEDDEKGIEKYENLLYEDAVEFEIIDQEDQYEEVEDVEDEVGHKADYNGGEMVEIVALYDEGGQEVMASSPEAPPFSPISPGCSESSPSHNRNIEDNESEGNLYEAGIDEWVPESPSRKRGRGLLAGRGQRGRGRGRGRSAWKRGDRLKEICVTDDDVPKDLRDNILRITIAREAKYENNKKRKLKMAIEEEDDAGDEALFNGDESALHFEWHSMDNFSGQKEKFLPKKTGPTKPAKSAYAAFRQYWDDTILSYIVAETNRYAGDLAGSSDTFQKFWYETNIHEILVLFAFWMMLGIIRMPSTKCCFTTNRLLETRVFRTMFVRQRYENICRALHFVDNSTRNSESSRLFPIEHVINHLNSRFQSAYIPRQEVCIDESLLLWKGRLSFRQYIKTKAARFGIKTFELCESATGYLWSLLVYTGKDTIKDDRFPPSLLKSTKTVLKLIWPLLDKGYTLFMDSWYNCPLLARFLKRHRTDCVGTLRQNRCNVPLLMAHRNTLGPGEFLARHSGDTVVMAYQDKRTVFTISTYHGVEQMINAKPNYPAQWKPQVILDYNKNMGGVDRKDQQLEPYLLERKRCAKWSMKIFKRLLNCSILNSRIILQHSAAKNIDHLVFRLELVEQILDKHLEYVRPKAVPRTAQPKMSDVLSPTRFTNNTHWPRFYTVRLADGHRSRRRCVWCSRRNQSVTRTSTECEACEVPLCLEPCFKLYHTQR